VKESLLFAFVRKISGLVAPPSPAASMWIVR